MRQLELRFGRVAPLEVSYGLEELGLVAQRAGDRPQAADVLGVPPPGVVPPAVGVGDERGAAQAKRLSEPGGAGGR